MLFVAGDLEVTGDLIDHGDGELRESSDGLSGGGHGTIVHRKVRMSPNCHDIFRLIAVIFDLHIEVSFDVVHGCLVDIERRS